MNALTLEDLLKELQTCEGADCEGDRNYRVHIRVAEQLIKEAYRLGAKQGELL